ncbi:MAG TPA: GTPase HflX [Candidatus Methanomethylophilaceae archaeon]|nr:GTPase HflX [Candidatus Methanomethylophilaceae archaeon]
MTIEKAYSKNVCVITLKENVSEIQDLCDSLGYTISFVTLQRREKPDRSTFFGKGKLTSLKEILENSSNVDLVVVNDEITPLQHYNLETILKRECTDRLGLVLEIFARNVHDRQAKLQVEKATLLYNLPLIKEWVHREKENEHPGFMGGGEYSIRGYENLIRSRLVKIENELENLKNNISRRSERRRRRGFRLIGLCGYTNAGKSSLMKELTSEDIFIDDKVFSTLDITTRRIYGFDKGILISDTIGFMDGLPPYMIESFQSTLEQIFTADLILLVIDVSEDFDTVMKKVNTSLQILGPVAYTSRLMAILNKTDIAVVDVKEITSNIHTLYGIQSITAISALKGDGLEELKEKISLFFRNDVFIHMVLPQSPSTEQFVSWLYDNTDIDAVHYDESVKVSLMARRKDVDRIEREVVEIGGSLFVQSH